jgi:hypothetical protein
MEGHAAGMREGRDIRLYAKFWLGILRERDLLEDTDIDGTIILRSIFSKLDVGVMGRIELAE